MNHRRGAATLGVGLAFVVAALTTGYAAAQSSGSEAHVAPAHTGPDDEQNYILYQVRPGEDPSKVAHMFHLTVEELLATNHISDPHRLGVGATLKIPDPRATRLAELQKQKDGLQQQLVKAQGTIGELQGTIHSLESQVAGLREGKEALERERTFYPIWRAAVFVSAAVAAAAAVTLLLVWAKARDESRRHKLALKEVELLHTAVEKHRQLSAQFELRYQNLFHQGGLPAGVQERAQALRRVYDDDRERLDAIVAEAERELKGAAAAALTPESSRKRGKAPVVRLSAARKSS